MTDTTAAAPAPTPAPAPTAAPATAPTTGAKGAGLATTALILISVHWVGHAIVAVLSTLYYATPVLDWTLGADGIFFTVLGGLGIAAFIIGLGYLGLSIAALARSRSARVGRARAGGAVALSIAYLLVVADSIMFALLATLTYGADFLPQLGLNP